MVFYLVQIFLTKKDIFHVQGQISILRTSSIIKIFRTIRLTKPLADLRAPPARASHHPPPPQRDPILSFSHVFQTKSTHVGCRHPERQILDPLLEKRGRVRSNTRYVHLVVTPSAVRQLNCRLCPLRRKKGCRDHTIVCVGF